MRYIIKQNGTYYFRRKIPSTLTNFTFSLKTKNGKIALQKVAYFLRYAEPLFIDLKFLSKEEIMNNISQIQNILQEYKREALKEYSKLEEDRHSDFTCEKKNGDIRDGGHPKCIKKWLKTLKEAVFSKHNQKYIELFERIFQRTGIDKELYENLTEEEKKFFRIELLKTEAKILKKDYERAKERFDTDLLHHETEVKNIEALPKTNKLYEKTAHEILEDFYKVKNNDTKEMHKYKEPIGIFLQVVGRKYLADITAEDMQDFVFTIKNIPPKTNKKNIELIKNYENNYFELAKIVSEKEYDKISLKTALEKIRRVNIFLDYAVEIERLDKNRLNTKYIMPSRAEIQRILDKEEQERFPFDNEELNTLFNNSSWFSTKLKKYIENEQDRIYIPLIGLFSGMRINEISQFYLDDIQVEDNIYYFRIDKTHKEQKLKNKKAKRIVPIHSKLIELGFLKYIEKLKSNKEERVFPQLYYTNNKGYGQAFSKKFNNKNFKKEWIKPEKLNDDKIKADFHSFRHTFASRLVGRVEDSIVDKIMGHVGSSENKNRYSKINIKELKKAIEKLDIEGIDFSNIQKLFK